MISDTMDSFGVWGLVQQGADGEQGDQGGNQEHERGGGLVHGAYAMKTRNVEIQTPSAARRREIRSG
jgi:hypothetical protein